jgi:hypothetical protein
MDAILSGVLPTGRYVEVPFVLVMGLERDRCPKSTSIGTRPLCWCRPACSRPGRAAGVRLEQAKKLLGQVSGNALMTRWAESAPTE